MIFSTKDWPALQIPVWKSRPVTVAFYKNIVHVLKKILEILSLSREYVRLLHDSLPACKEQIVTSFLMEEMVRVPVPPPLSPDLKFSYQLKGTSPEVPKCQPFIGVCRI